MCEMCIIVIMIVIMSTINKFILGKNFFVTLMYVFRKHHGLNIKHLMVDCTTTILKQSSHLGKNLMI